MCNLVTIGKPRLHPQACRGTQAGQLATDTGVRTRTPQGRNPDLFQLQQELYDAMAHDYSVTNVGRGFPLQEFSRSVLEQMMADFVELKEADWSDELVCMERHRLVVKRMKQSDGTTYTSWSFRHDKIRDFFALQMFLGADNPNPVQHLGDPRFSGVYFMLAGFLPLAQAVELERRLIDYAVDHSDHAVSDEFVRRLRTRSAA